jgi:hypothetical protein
MNRCVSTRRLLFCQGRMAHEPNRHHHFTRDPGTQNHPRLIDWHRRPSGRRTLFRRRREAALLFWRSSFWNVAFWNVAFEMWLLECGFAEMQAGAVPVLPRNECGAGSAPGLKQALEESRSTRSRTEASTNRSARMRSGESRRGASVRDGRVLRRSGGGRGGLVGRHKRMEKFMGPLLYKSATQRMVNQGTGAGSTINQTVRARTELSVHILPMITFHRLGLVTCRVNHCRGKVFYMYAVVSFPATRQQGVD